MLCSPLGSIHGHLRLPDILRVPRKTISSLHLHAPRAGDCCDPSLRPGCGAGSPRLGAPRFLRRHLVGSDGRGLPRSRACCLGGDLDSPRMQLPAPQRTDEAECPSWVVSLTLDRCGRTTGTTEPPSRRGSSRTLRLARPCPKEAGVGAPGDSVDLFG